MGSDNRILIALATVFVTAECYLPFVILRETTPSSCVKRLDSCGNVWGSGAFNIFELDRIQALIDNINGICQRRPQYAVCVRPLLKECTADRFAIDASLAVGEFTCSDRGRSLLAESTASVCYSDPSHQVVVNELSHKCITSRFHDNLTQCQIMNIRAACAAEATTQHCGKALGDFIRELANRLVATTPQLQC